MTHFYYFVIHSRVHQLDNFDYTDSGVKNIEKRIYMKQSVWILNSSLLILFFISQLFLFMLQKAVPRRISIAPTAGIVIKNQVVEPVNIATIYENDLFGTYQTPASVSTKIDDSILPMPQPPKNIVSQVPLEKAPTFFAPLQAILKGVIFVKDDPASSLAIIQFKKTKEEQNYQVGDLIEDAQILKILPNRIIIIRSNGQQETLYLREEDAVHDFDAESTYLPKNVIESSSGNKYKINIDEFVNRISNLGEFISMLDLTTVYRQGKSFGCRVGKISTDSLGAMLGFKADDIIIKIDGYPLDDVTHRLAIYDHILTSASGDIIEVEILRNNISMTMLYGLIDNAFKNSTFTQQDMHQKLVASLTPGQEPQDVTIQRKKVPHESENKAETDNFLEDRAIIEYQASSPMMMQVVCQEKLHQLDNHKNKLSQDREKMEPIIQDIKAQDRKNMLKQSKRNVIFNGMTQ